MDKLHLQGKKKTLEPAMKPHQDVDRPPMGTPELQDVDRPPPMGTPTQMPSSCALLRNSAVRG